MLKSAIKILASFKFKTSLEYWKCQHFKASFTWSLNQVQDDEVQYFQFNNYSGQQCGPPWERENNALMPDNC